MGDTLGEIGGGVSMRRSSCLAARLRADWPPQPAGMRAFKFSSDEDGFDPQRVGDAR